MLETTTTGLDLRPLGPGHAAAYHALVQHDRDHLTAHGNYLDEVAASAGDFEQWFSAPEPDPPVRFGIWWNDDLVGRCELVPVDPPRFGLGYWICEACEGKGLASAAVRRLLDHARDRCDATDVFAGVTHGNLRSVALLHRLGFTEAVRFDDYTRFHRSLGSAGSQAT